MQIKYTNGRPVEHGDIVHVKNRPYTVDSYDQKSGYVYARSMDESRTLRPLYPRDIGAYWDNVNPIFAEVLNKWRL
jgi:hypothetical protein